MNTSRTKRLPLLKATVVLSALALTLYAFSSGPPAGRTGGFGEPTCMGCHQYGPGDGRFVIVGVPVQYVPGEVYTITVKLRQPGQMRWGFELAVRYQSDGTQAGTINVTDPDDTKITMLNGVQYISHTTTGTYEGTPDGPVYWTFDWVAPSDVVDTVQFNAAGNAADDSHTPLGDYIYTDRRDSRPVDDSGTSGRAGS